MITIRPFKGIRPTADIAARLASKPYDVLNSEEARKEAEGNEQSFYRVIKPEIDLPAGTDLYSDEVYAKAAENFNLFRQEGWLIQDEKPCMYVYRQIMDGIPQHGLVAGSSVQDYFDDKIKKHEFTRPVKENDRIRHMDTVSAHLGPVFLTYPDVDEIDAIVNKVVSSQPNYDFTAEDGVQHTFWVVDDESTINGLASLFNQKVEATYIADGHHRAASSAKVGTKRKEANANHTGEEEYNYFLSVLFPASQLRIIDYNRVVTDLNGMSKDEFLNALNEKFDVNEKGGESYKPASPYHFGMYLDGLWYELNAKDGTYDANDPIDCLDVSVISNNLLDPILGIKDQRTDDRIDFVGGIRGIGELERRVNDGGMKIAFAIHPVSIQQLIDIADSGNVMPPKSTWFEPKLRSGLIVHEF